MDFISNLIKRPISLVLNDTLPTTDQMQKSTPSTPIQKNSNSPMATPLSPSPTPPMATGGRATTPQRTIAAAAVASNNSSNNGSNLLDSFGMNHVFLPIAAPIIQTGGTTTPSPKSTPSPTAAMFYGLQNASNTDTTNSPKSPGGNNRTIEELLIQINDSLNQASLNDEAEGVTFGHKFPRNLSISTPSPASLPFAELSPLSTKSSSLRLSSSPHPKDTSSTTSVTPKATIMSPTANTTPTPQEKKPQKHVIPPRPTLGIPEFDESSIPDLPQPLEDIIFEDCFIPTLTANISQQSSSLSLKTKDELYNKAPPQFLAVGETDTALSSDSEIYAECQPYEDVPLNINPVAVDNLPEFSTINDASMDDFFSAANSRNTTLTAVDPLSITTEYVNVLPEAAEIDASVDVLPAPQLTPNIVHNPCHNDVEPMDVDISFTQQQLLQDALKSPIKINKESNSPKGEIVVSTEESIIVLKEQCSPIAEAQKATEKTTVGRKSPLAKINSELVVELTEYAVLPLNKSLEASSNGSIPNGSPKKTDVIQDSSIDSGGNDMETMASLADAAYESPKSNESGSANTTTKTVDVLQTETSTPLKVASTTLVDERGNCFESLAVLNTSTSSRKSSTSSRPSFPIKQNANDLEQFPRSPTKVVEREMSYLEKSEYTEKKEIERKKSLVANTPPKITKDSDAEKSKTHKTETPTTPNRTASDSNFNQDTLPIAPVSSHSAKQDEPSNNEERDDKRRTFNMPLPLAKLALDEVEANTPILANKLPASDPNARRTFTITSENAKEFTENEANSTFGSTSPPIPTLMKRLQIGEATEPSNSAASVQKTLQPSTTTPITAVSPPVPALLNRQKICTDSLSATALPSSPHMPAFIDHEPPPLEPRLREPFELMPPPPLPPVLARSPPITKLQKRPPIHPPSEQAELPEALSDKEKTKSNSSDEKDIFTGTCTPSPMEEIAASDFAGFGGAGGTAEMSQEELDDEEFQCGSNLILKPSDFDYLLTKGGSNNEPVARNSILLKFDPLLGVHLPVTVNQQQQPPAQSKQAQQILNQILGNNQPASCLSPILAEDEAEHRSLSASPTTSNHNQSPDAYLQKHASMSVDVIKDMNVDNDCNKSFENSNIQSDAYKMDGNDLEKKIKNEVLKTEDIEKKLKEAEQREETLIKRITEKDKVLTKMNAVMEAYEKAIAELIAEKEQQTQNYEKQLNEVKTDRDLNYQHLTSLEMTFSDLHFKYEKSKEMTLQLKSNEESLLSEKRQILENLRLQEQRYDKMKNHAMQQLEIANKKLEALNKEHSVETTKLKALLKKEEISRASINEQLQQKSRENAELVKICDELINGQGS